MLFEFWAHRSGDEPNFHNWAAVVVGGGDLYRLWGVRLVVRGNEGRLGRDCLRAPG